jgi:putative tricarboxylic transport membrane protein
MRRDDFLKSLAGAAIAGALPWRARAAVQLRMMIPANPGGGWDATGRTLGRALVDAGAADAVIYDNKGGAAGTLGLAQFIVASRGDPEALMMMGAVMLGGIIAGKPPVDLSTVTPLARLTSEYNVFVLPAQSHLRTMRDVLAQLKKDPATVKWGGGSRGSTEHLAAAMIARDVGLDPARINYVSFRGGGEAAAAVLGGLVTVGGSSYSEFAEFIRAGRMKAIAVTSPVRLRGLDAPTLKELGLDVELGNWRGIYGAPAIAAAQRARLIERILKALRTRTWTDALRSNAWTSAVLTGDAFARFVDEEFAKLRATMATIGMA